MTTLANRIRAVRDSGNLLGQNGTRDELTSIALAVEKIEPKVASAKSSSKKK